MKRYLHTNNPLAPLLFATLLLFGTAPAMAQHQQHQQRAGQQAWADTSAQMMGMMQGGMTGMMQMHMQMMQQAMQHPLQRAGMMVHMLPTMQEPLDLSEDQAARLDELATQFEQRQHALQEKAESARQQLREMMTAGGADQARVQALLRDVAMHRADQQALAYEMASKMEAVLSAEQRDGLAAMNPMQLHHHMMGHMTMMEMMQTMRSGMTSGMNCPMMQEGMMPGSMMGMMQR